MILAGFLFVPLLWMSNHQNETLELSCQHAAETIVISDTLSNTKLFFDYEVIEHYYNPMPDYVMSQGRYVKAEYERKYAIARYDIPKDISDTAFIDDLTYFGYRKRYMKPTKFRELNKIFCKKDSIIIKFCGCHGFYTDILVFKKDEVIVGIAKISFEGRQAYFVGSKVDTNHFGYDGEFEKLKSILGRK